MASPLQVQLDALWDIILLTPGEVSEWSMVQSWKDCLRQKRNEGSNPSFSEFLLASR